MKKCNTCAVEQPQESFSRKHNTKSGRSGICKRCDALRAAQYRKKKSEQAKACVRNWRKKYPARAKATDKKQYWSRKAARLEYNKKYYTENFVRVAAQKAAYKKRNHSKFNFLKAQEKAQKCRATPAWANQGYIEDVYRKTAIFTKRDGTPWHVDHIVPLKSKLVCGLHREDNLQALPGVENITKGNRHWPDMLGA